MRSRLRRAVARYNRTTLSGYNHATNTWEPLVGIGSLQVYDRFITERSFGQKKRIFYCADGNQFDAEKYPIIKAGGSDNVYMVESQNPDLADDKAYAHAYLMKQCAGIIEVHRLVAGTLRASGVGGQATLTKTGESWGDLERYSAINSRGLDDVDYTVVTISLPKFIDVDSDCTIIADGKKYDVTEVTNNLGLQLIRAQRIG